MRCTRRLSRNARTLRTRPFANFSRVSYRVRVLRESLHQTFVCSVLGLHLCSTNICIQYMLQSFHSSRARESESERTFTRKFVHETYILPWRMAFVFTHYTTTAHVQRRSLNRRRRCRRRLLLRLCSDDCAKRIGVRDAAMSTIRVVVYICVPLNSLDEKSEQ